MENKTPQQKAELIGAWFSKISPLHKDLIARKTVTYFISEIEYAKNENEKEADFNNILAQWKNRTPLTIFYGELQNPRKINLLIDSLTATATSLLRSQNEPMGIIPLGEYLQEYSSENAELPLKLDESVFLKEFDSVYPTSWEEFDAMMPGNERYEKLTNHYYALLEARETWFELLDNELFNYEN